MLVLAWLYFSFQTIAIFVDTYTRGFIALAIAEKKVIYNISWEDPRVERVHITQDDVVLTISSAGCNVLDYLIENPKKIVAADLNEAQLAVLDLKLACLKAKMPHADFFALWGRSDPRVFQKWYATLRDLLRAGSREFWDDTSDSLFQNNFMFSGTSGLMAYFLMLAARPLGISGSLQRNLGSFASDSFMFRIISSIVAAPFVWKYVAPLIGVPPEQVALVERRPSLFSERILEIVAKRMWSEDNYFYHGYCVGQFDPFPKCPRYMSELHYASLMDRVHKVELFHGSWGDAQSQEPFTFVSLLDSMDWMPPSLAAGLLKNVLQRSSENVKVFWRSYAPGPAFQKSPNDLFTPHSPALAQLEPVEVTCYDRVGWYLSQWLATPKNLNPANLDPRGLDSTYSNSFMDDLRVCLAMAAHGLRPNKDVATFYRSQGPRYDGFRESLLPDRDTLLKYALPWSRYTGKDKYSLACVGCGTARDLEFVAPFLKSLGKKIALVDLSPELLQVARGRIAKLGLDADVFCVDCTDLKQLEPLIRQVSFVTCSFCLTMIPDWQRALSNLEKLVAPGGFLGLVDFVSRFDRESDCCETLLRNWFAMDGVYFNRAHVHSLVQITKPYFYSEHRSRVPYTPFYPTHYIYVGAKKSPAAY